MTKTSISLPLTVWQKLKEGEKRALLTSQNLAMKCLKRLKKNAKALKLARRNTIRYNPNTCEKKLYFLWSESEHNYVQTMRITEKNSVSHLICEAINKYLDTIIKVLLRPRLKRKYFAHIENNFAYLHRKISFQHKNIVALRIVMPRSPDIHKPTR